MLSFVGAGGIEEYDPRDRGGQGAVPRRGLEREELLLITGASLGSGLENEEVTGAVPDCSLVRYVLVGTQTLVICLMGGAFSLEETALVEREEVLLVVLDGGL